MKLHELSLLKAPKRVLSVSVAVLLPARVKPPVKARRSEGPFRLQQTARL